MCKLSLRLFGCRSDPNITSFLHWSASDGCELFSCEPNLNPNQWPNLTLLPIPKPINSTVSGRQPEVVSCPSMVRCCSSYNSMSGTPHPISNPLIHPPLPLTLLWHRYSISNHSVCLSSHPRFCQSIEASEVKISFCCP